MVYLDQAATSFPKIDTVKQAVIEAMEVAGNANRSANMDASRLIFKHEKTWLIFSNTRFSSCDIE